MSFSQNLTLQEALETAAQINRELNVLRFAKKKKFKLLIDRFSSFLLQRRKSVEKTIHQKKNRGH